MVLDSCDVVLVSTFLNFSLSDFYPFFLHSSVIPLNKAKKIIEAEEIQKSPNNMIGIEVKRETKALK